MGHWSLEMPPSICFLDNNKCQSGARLPGIYWRKPRLPCSQCRPRQSNARAPKLLIASISSERPSRARHCRDLSSIGLRTPEVVSQWTTARCARPDAEQSPLDPAGLRSVGLILRCCRTVIDRPPESFRLSWPLCGGRMHRCEATSRRPSWRHHEFRSWPRPRRYRCPGSGHSDGLVARRRWLLAVRTPERSR